MAHMTREFTLVLLGSSILTAGYFLWPEEDLEAKADQQAAQQVAGANHRTRAHLHPLIWIHSPRMASSGMSAKPTVSRSGFGGIGRGVAAAS